MDTLVLNADGQPISMLPPSTVQWKEAISYLWLDKVNVLEWYDDWVVRSATWETKVPAVIMLKTMARHGRHPRFSKYNIQLRDLFTCQYCSKPFSPGVLTLDHVLPISKGGKTSWTNIVCACQKCNSSKSDKLHIRPIREPYRPDYWDLVNKRKTLGFTIKHPSWQPFLK